MKIRPSARWTARRAGGLFLGLRIHFFAGLCDPSQCPMIHWRRVGAAIGFGPFTINLDFDWGHHTEDDGC